MKSFDELFKKRHMGEFILIILMIIYLTLGFRTPEIVANLVDNVVGRVVIILVVIYLFIYSHPMLAVLALVAFDLMRRSNDTTGLGALKDYAPTEEKKAFHFSAFNQFPYTLEQEVVAKMAPVVRSGNSLTPPSYKPILEDLHDASKV